MVIKMVFRTFFFVFIFRMYLPSSFNASLKLALIRI